MSSLTPPSPLSSESQTQELLGKLAAWMRGQTSLLVAYSGGVDSALVMAMAHQQLGDRALACIGVSPSYAEREYQGAIALAKQLGAAVRIVQTEEHLDPRYTQNPANRCYFCKSELYTRLADIAQKEKFSLIVDGNNASDLSDDRPGSLAAKQKGVRSPLAELGITKEQVRAIAKVLGLPVWDKPAMPCLSSRVPHGTPIVPGMLKQIEQAEDVLIKLGFKELRVRHHGDVARIEVRPEDLGRILQLRQEICRGVLAAGYKFVAMDLVGLQSGSLHRASKDA